MARNLKSIIDATYGDRPEVDFEAGRRAFIRGLGAGAAGAAAVGLASAGTATPAVAQTAPNLDLAILNFALNLEYLEAEFYLNAATGSGIPAAYTGPNPGQVTGGQKVKFQTGLVKAYAEEIAQEEFNHVKFLRAAITAAGSTPVSQPNINIGSAFTTAAQAAHLIGPGETFNAYQNDHTFLLAAYIFEDVGVTAYHGAAPLITNKTYLDKAAGILAVEAYHAGLIRTVLFADGYSKQTQLISSLRATLDGTQSTGTPDDYGVGVKPDSTIVLADANSIAFDRTTSQVLNIVYGNTTQSPGLFFPNGMNGTIR